jgi:hypothetical protein
MRFFVSRRHGRLVMFTSLLSVALVAAPSLGVTDATTASQSKIAIHERGTNLQDSGPGTGVRGTFTIEFEGRRFGPAGTTLYFGTPGPTRYVHGQAQVPYSGTDHLMSKKGKIDLAVSGIRIDLNPKVTPSGNVFGPVVRYGTWKVASATGIYKGWKGGGNFAAVFYGYKNIQPYSVEWDGYITP